MMDSESAESQVTGDGVKEILAPAEGPRENLISTAVKFLQNPKVMSSPLYQKKAFLEKKGLTQTEIDLAVQRAGVVEQASGGVSNGQVPQAGQMQVYAPGAVQPLQTPIPPQSMWARARDLTMTTMIVASVSYAVYQLLQTYLRPWFMGQSAQERRLERLEQEVKAMKDSVEESVGQISRNLAAIQASLAEQQQQSLSNHGELKGISDLKADVASLKGLMLSKKQFPALPTAAPILPSWQRNTTSSVASIQPVTSSSSSSSTTYSSSTPQEPSPAVEEDGSAQSLSNGDSEPQAEVANTSVSSASYTISTDATAEVQPDQAVEGAAAVDSS